MVSTEGASMSDHLSITREYVEAAEDAMNAKGRAHCLRTARAYALVSIAESLAVLAGDLREERMRSESLRQALAEARAEVDESSELIDRVWKIVNSDGTDVARLAAVHQAVTE